MEKIRRFCKNCYEEILMLRHSKQCCSPACRAAYSTKMQKISEGKLPQEKSLLHVDIVQYGGLDRSSEGHLLKYHYLAIDELNQVLNQIQTWQQKKAALAEQHQRNEHQMQVLAISCQQIEEQVEKLRRGEAPKALEQAKRQLEQNPMTTLEGMSRSFMGHMSVFLQDQQSKPFREEKIKQLETQYNHQSKQYYSLQAALPLLKEEGQSLALQIQEKQAWIREVLGRLNQGDFSGFKRYKRTPLPTPAARTSLTLKLPAVKDKEAINLATELVIKPLQRTSTSYSEKILSKGGSAILLGQALSSKSKVYYNPIPIGAPRLSNGHLLLIGMSGAGKSETIVAFLYEAFKKEIPFLVLDLDGSFTTNTYKTGKGTPFLKATKTRVANATAGMPFNPLEVGLDAATLQKRSYIPVIYELASSLSRIFGLGPIQEAALRKLLKEAFEENGFMASSKEGWNNPSPTLAQVGALLEEKLLTDPKNYQGIAARLEPLFDTQVFTPATSDDSKAQESFALLLAQNTILNLSTLATKELKVAVSQFILQKLYQYMLSEGPVDHIRQVLVIDEAHKLSMDESLTSLFREARKYGIVIILASHSAKDFDPVVFDLIATKIVMQLDGESAKTMANLMGETDAKETSLIRQKIMSLSPGRALVRNNHYSPYIEVKIQPLCEKE